VETLIEILPGLMFLALIVGLFTALPVPIVLSAVTVVFMAIALWLGEMRLVHISLIPTRIYGSIVDNAVLVAAPMFIFMGVVMEKTRIAEDLLLALQKLLARVPGGLALAVVLMGTILAAATGIIGASVVMLTVMALPTMLRAGYAAPLATGTVASAGTLGILIPPSVMLVFMSDLLSLNLAKVFVAAFLPGLFLAGVYLVYLVARAVIRPCRNPARRGADRRRPARAVARGAGVGQLSADPDRGRPRLDHRRLGQPDRGFGRRRLCRPGSGASARAAVAAGAGRGDGQFDPHHRDAVLHLRRGDGIFLRLPQDRRRRFHRRSRARPEPGRLGALVHHDGDGVHHGLLL
jgi:TRAP-type mannitol/chloroaromatic compound transport system permease large subunit